MCTWVHIPPISRLFTSDQACFLNNHARKEWRCKHRTVHNYHRVDVSIALQIDLSDLPDPPWVIRDNNARHFLKKHKRLDAAIDAYFNDSSSASSSSQPKLAGHALSTAEIVKQFNKYKGPDNIYYGKKTIIKMLSFQFQIRMVKTSLWTVRWSFVRTWKSILKTSFYSHWRTNWSPQGWLSGRNKGGLRAGRKCRAYTWSSPAGSWAKISFFNH